MRRLLPVASSTVTPVLLAGLLLLAAPGVGRADAASFDVDLWITPLGLRFGPVNTGDVSPAQTITIANVGTRTVDAFTPQLPADPQFQLTSTCDSGLEPGAQCTYSVRFAPTRAGQASAISRTETDAAVFEFSMRGEGVGPQLHYDARLLDFGALPVGARSAPQAVTVRNIGAQAVSGFTNPQPDARQFSAVAGCSDTLAPAESCTYAYEFRPTQVGKAEGTAEPDNTASPLNLAFMAWASPALNVDTRTLDFGRVAPGAVSQALTVTLTNLTTVPLTAISHTGPADPHFQMASTCGDTLAPSTSCTWAYTFTPNNTGAYEGTVEIVVGVQGVDGTERIPLVLHGVGCDQLACPVAPVTASRPAVDLGTAAVGTQSDPVTVTFTNNSIYTARFTGSTSTDPQFLVARSCGGGLEPDESCVATIRFRPFRPGTAKAVSTTTFELLDEADSVVMTDALTLSLQGYAIPGITYSPRAFEFPPIGVGEIGGPITVTVRSLGGVLAGFDGIAAPAPFTSTTTCDVDVPAFGTCTDVVRFSPDTPSRYTITRSIGTTLGLYELVMSGNGRPGALWATPSVLNFGTVTVGTLSAAQAVSVENTGLSALHFASAPVPDSPQYALQSDCPERLAPTERCTLTYRFQPGATGADDTEALLETSGGTLRIRLWGFATALVSDARQVYLPVISAN